MGSGERACLWFIKEWVHSAPPWDVWLRMGFITLQENNKGRYKYNTYSQQWERRIPLHNKAVSGLCLIEFDMKYIEQNTVAQRWQNRSPPSNCCLFFLLSCVCVCVSVGRYYFNAQTQINNLKLFICLCVCAHACVNPLHLSGLGLLP